MTLRAFADMYCWCCHLEDAMYTCKKCPRTYHRRCVFEMPNYPDPVFDSESMDPSSMVKCPECVVADDTVLYNMKKVSPTKLAFVLRYVIHNIKSDDFWYRTFYDVAKPNSNSQSRAVVVKFMDISQLEKNIDKLAYNSLEGFFGDAKWIRHNIAVTAGRKSDEMLIAEKLLQYIASQMLEIDLCHECYVRRQERDKWENWFVRACSRPHLLGWVKIDNLVYWPAKIMGVDLLKSLAIVHFFGEHTQEEVPLKKCLIYSEAAPHSTRKLKGQIHGWKRACKEMKRHIENLDERHGKVVLVEEKTRITCTLPEAVQRMFPDWKLRILNAETPAVTHLNLALADSSANQELSD